MLICIIVAAVICLGVLFTILNSYSMKDYSAPASGLLMIGAISLFFCSAFLISNRATIDADYENALYEKSVIEYRLTQQDMKEWSITINGGAYNDAVDFNNRLRKTKYYVSSPWFNWFNNEKIATIDYIDLNIGG